MNDRLTQAVPKTVQSNPSQSSPSQSNPSQSEIAQPRTIQKELQTVLPGLIRQIRQRLGLTQTQFAKKLGVSFLSVNRWENGHHQPLPIVLKQIEALLREMGAEGQDLLEQYAGEVVRNS